MILPESSPDLFVLIENRTKTTITTYEDASSREQQEMGVSQTALEVVLLRDSFNHLKAYYENHITKVVPGAKKNSRKNADFLKFKARRNDCRPKISREESSTASNTSHRAISVKDNNNDSVKHGKLLTFNQLLDPNRCQQVATIEEVRINSLLQTELVPNIVAEKDSNSYPLPHWNDDFAQNSETRIGSGGDREKSTQLTLQLDKISSKRQMNDCSDIKGSSRSLCKITRSYNASSIELSILEARVLPEESARLDDDDDKQLGKLLQQPQLLQHCSFEREIQKQQHRRRHEQQPSYSFRQKSLNSEDHERVCSKCQSTSHRLQKRLMKASDYSCLNSRPKSLRLLTSRLILFLCLVLSIRTNLNNNCNSSSSSSFFRHNSNVFLSLGLVDALSNPKIDSLPPDGQSISSSEKNHQANLTQIEGASHELSKILGRISRQRDFGNLPKSHSSSSNNPGNSDNERESLLSSLDYESTYNSGANINDSDEDSSKIQKYFNSTSTSSNEAEADGSYMGSKTNNGGSEAGGDIKSFLDKTTTTTTNNQSKISETMFENRFESVNSSSTLIGSLFSHIDKQWNFAEVILVIVISAILNLVTIIGNIMVLISFKMDRS